MLLPALRATRLRGATLLLLAACAGGDAAGGGAAGAPAALPPELAAALDVGALLDSAGGQPAGQCRTTVDATSGQLRRTIQARLPAGDTRVVFVRAAPADSSLQRVEVVHRPAGGAQLGVTWSARDDDVRVVRYTSPASPADAVAPGYDRATVARALREVGERAMARPCGGA